MPFNYAHPGGQNGGSSSKRLLGAPGKKKIFDLGHRLARGAFEGIQFLRRKPKKSRYTCYNMTASPTPKTMYKKNHTKFYAGTACFAFTKIDHTHQPSAQAQAQTKIPFVEKIGSSRKSKKHANTNPKQISEQRLRPTQTENK